MDRAFRTHSRGKWYGHRCGWSAVDGQTPPIFLCSLIQYGYRQRPLGRRFTYIMISLRLRCAGKGFLRFIHTYERSMCGSPEDLRAMETREGAAVSAALRRCKAARDMSVFLYFQVAHEYVLARESQRFWFGRRAKRGDIPLPALRKITAAGSNRTARHAPEGHCCCC